MTKTVFVIGAGASREVHLPTGDGLRGVLAGALNLYYSEAGVLLSGDPLLDVALKSYRERIRKEHGRNVHPVHAARRISGAMTVVRSIDQFLDQHREDPEIQICGKIAIVLSILRAERNSLFWVDESKALATIPFDAVAPTWFSGLWQLISDGCDVGEVVERFKSISFVVFNYDRCIEHFLYHATQATYYELSAKDAAQIVEGIEIFHPYGTVGSLPWCQQAKEPIAFGAEPSVPSLFTLADEVKIFTESEQSELMARAHDRLHKADTVVYVGFGYHQQNLALLWPTGKQPCRAGLQIGSAWRISDDSMRFLGHRIADLSGTHASNVRLYNLECASFLGHNWYQLHNRVTGR